MIFSACEDVAVSAVDANKWSSRVPLPCFDPLPRRCFSVGARNSDIQLLLYNIANLEQPSISKNAAFIRQAQHEVGAVASDTAGGYRTAPAGERVLKMGLAILIDRHLDAVAPMLDVPVRTNELLHAARVALS